MVLTKDRQRSLKYRGGNKNGEQSLEKNQARFGERYLPISRCHPFVECCGVCGNDKSKEKDKKKGKQHSKQPKAIARKKI